MTFAALFSSAGDLADALGRAGIEHDRAVAVILPNSLAFVPAILALWKLGVPIALISPKYRESEIKAVTDALQPQGLLTVSAFTPQLKAATPVDRQVTVAFAETESPLELLFPPPVAAPSGQPAATVTDQALHPAVYKFTSGSTGTPKGIAVTAENLFAEAQNVTATLAITTRDCLLAPVPLFHSYGFDLGVLSMLFAGARLISQEGFIPRKMLMDLASREVTLFLGVPSMYRLFVDTPLSALPDLSHIRYLLSCTAPLPPELISAFAEKFRMPICQHYGSSETGAVANHRPAEVLARPGSVGLPLHNVRIKIVNEKGEELSPMQEGEVIVRSGVVSPGYVMGNPPGPSRFAGDTYRTGDIGLVDEEGFLYLRGRIDDVINVGGFKVSPYEVIQVLEKFPAVREAAATGVRNANGEEVVCAMVTLKSPASEAEILAFCRAQLSDYKVPRRIEIRDEMPRGPSGKIKITAKDFAL
jgi:long-chain acyl-CoA synthetase